MSAQICDFETEGLSAHNTEAGKLRKSKVVDGRWDKCCFKWHGAQLGGCFTAPRHQHERTNKRKCSLLPTKQNKIADRLLLESFTIVFCRLLPAQVDIDFDSRTPVGLHLHGRVNMFSMPTGLTMAQPIIADVIIMQLWSWARTATA